MRWIATVIFILSIAVANAGDNETNIERLKAEYNTLLAEKAVNSLKYHRQFEESKLQHDLLSMKHRQESLSFQYMQGWVIFIVVMVLVLGGFYLAFLQFKLDEKITLAKAEIDNISDKSLSDTTLEVSKEGVKITSSVIGLIVLGMSFAFFYMYIKHVYTITELSSINSSKLPAEVVSENES